MASRMTARHSPLFTLESGQTGLRIYTSQRDAALEIENKRLAALNSRMDAFLFNADSSSQTPPATGSN